MIIVRFGHNLHYPFKRVRPIAVGNSINYNYVTLMKLFIVPDPTREARRQVFELLAGVVINSRIRSTIVISTHMNNRPLSTEDRTSYIFSLEIYL